VPRIRRRGAGLVLGAAVLFLAGTNVQSGWLFVMSSLLLGAALAGVLIPSFMVRKISVSRRSPAEAFVGDEVAVDLVVANEKRTTKLSIAVRDPHVSPATVFVPELRGGETVTGSTIRRASRRGVVDGGEVVVASSAPFGVAEARRTVPAGGRTVIYPRVVPVPSLPLLEAGWDMGETGGAGRGDGLDFLGVREYRRGDSLRHVHWPSTARHGSLVVREFEQERPARLVIVVDTWADAFGSSGESALDRCCSAAASIALAALTSGHRVALAAARGGEVGAPEDVDRRALLTRLAEFQAPGGPTLPVALDAVASLTRGSGAWLLVFPTWRPNGGRSLQRAARELVSRGSRVAAVVVDASSLAPPVPVLAGAEVEELCSDLTSSGVEVYLVRPEEDLATCLARAGAS